MHLSNVRRGQPLITMRCCTYAQAHCHRQCNNSDRLSARDDTPSCERILKHLRHQIAFSALADLVSAASSQSGCHRAPGNTKTLPSACAAPRERAAAVASNTGTNRLPAREGPDLRAWSPKANYSSQTDRLILAIPICSPAARHKP